jgi:hypothetical protein
MRPFTPYKNALAHALCLFQKKKKTGALSGKNDKHILIMKRSNTIDFDQLLSYCMFSFVKETI